MNLEDRDPKERFDSLQRCVLRCEAPSPSCNCEVSGFSSARTHSSTTLIDDFQQLTSFPSQVALSMEPLFGQAKVPPSQAWGGLGQGRLVSAYPISRILCPLYCTTGGVVYQCTQQHPLSNGVKSHQEGSYGELLLS